MRQTVDATPFLFKPATAVRERPAGFTGTPMPKDEPLAPNPPFGAYIDYVLDAAPAAPITLEIFDAQNALVRRYSSADEPPAIDPSKLRTAPEWFAVPSTLQTTPGMHRFVWPIRYEGTQGVWSDGVWAPPGEYRVALTVDGRRLEQPLRIVPDPRVKLPLSAYAVQFALAKKIDAVRAAVAAAVGESDALLEKTTDESLRARITVVAGVAVPFGTMTAANVPPLTTTLRFILSALESLLEAVDGADAAPSPDARASFARLQADAQRALEAFRSAAPKPPL
jgi:hypothetical protein